MLSRAKLPFCEDVLPHVSDGLLRHLGRVDLLRTTVAEGVRHHPIRLVAVLSGELPVPVQHLFRQLNLLGIPRPVRRNLGGSSTFAADLFQLGGDLRPARARCLQVLPRVTLDLRLAMVAALNLISQTLQPGGKLRPVNRRGERLRLE